MELIETVHQWIAELTDKDQLWVLHAFATVVATLAVAMVVGLLLRRAERRADQSDAIWLMMVFRALRAPAKAAIWLVGLTWASHITHSGTDLELAGAVETVRQTGIALAVAWFLVRLIGQAEAEFLQPRIGEPRDPTSVTAVGKLLRVAVIITTGLALLQSFGYSVSGVMAFGGLGGLAVGFAAKDLLANFFGGLMIYMDRPFAVGEWIRSPDREIEGVVENIGWRLTRIRTFDRRPLYVPNATFTQVSVENPSRMENRRILETIGVRYDDAGKMKDIIDDVTQMLIDHEDLETENRTLICNFTTFAASSLNFFIYTFTKTVNWVEFHGIKQDVLLRTIEIIERHGAQCAFPTSTLHIPEPVALRRGAQPEQSNPDDSEQDRSGHSSTKDQSPEQTPSDDSVSGKNRVDEDDPDAKQSGPGSL